MIRRCEVQLVRLLRLWWGVSASNALAWLLRYRGHMSVGRARLLSFVPLFLLVLHLITCAWQAVGGDATSDRGWQASDPLLMGRRNSSGALYVRGVWWASVTLVTIGFGDIVPTQVTLRRWSKLGLKGR